MDIVVRRAAVAERNVLEMACRGSVFAQSAVVGGNPDVAVVVLTKTVDDVAVDRVDAALANERLEAA